ncbi:glycosyltransferase [Leptolyngbya sp. FACHB-711]|uniref:glycosyltransferase family 2 protein n=1 Tax=Leptolyngbya sp. FACHB-711 TaxID=2692813 RepID=UPI001686E1EC|nr:glycosyltransferase [Leptolyngbya sp. FACHB-711]MBD2028209.1 glycosyltransferase family 2 protein [Leptolyngbya sp. FACHB-711]
MKASVIVPSYRRFQPLLNTVRALQKQKYPDFEIIVVDQNPAWPDECQAILQEIRQDPRVAWLSQEKPEVVIARNTAVQQAKGDIIIFIDDDVEINDQQFIERHLANYSDPSIHVVIGRECQKKDDTEQFLPEELQNSSSLEYLSKLSPLQQTLWFDRNSNCRTPVCSFSTCNGSMRKEVFLAVGGFDEGFRGNSYGDDYDLILRLNKLGYQSVYDPKAWLIHLKVPMGGLRMSDLKNRVNYSRTSTGFWLFLLRHSTPSMFWHLLYNHVLRKTVLLKANLRYPWRQFVVIPGVISGLLQAWILLKEGPKSCFKVSQES